ncbi:MAG TPA: NUDIX hydrolase [Candidatus Dormibacteraeota bacterium]|jgi:8-oxo-dGTP pyrophosphatase MutT (NUDIX family)|nr:NUDIX hydrolase [Candidatus Dormibacteraeota bacterium]
MPPQRRNHDEVSAGGVVVRRSPETGGWEAALIRVGQAWSLPKGNLDKGETPEQAALREISEETGLPMDRLQVLGELPASEYMYRRQGRLVSKIVHHYLVEAPGDAPLRPQEREVDEVEWVPLAEAARRVTYRDLRAAFEEAKRGLGTE